ncbi:MAG: helix-turn-helix transcriptional regulator [Bacteroidales bacterium]|nr:helix-turn-helix transcriptional regulator [Bacteroidales bacterium]
MAHQLFCEAGHSKGNIARNTIVEKTLSLLEQKYMNDLKTAYVAQQVGVSERHLQRVLKSKTHKTFREHLNQIRLEKARAMLIGTNASIQEILENVGYQDYSHFAKVFKAVHDLTPARYREKYKELYSIFKKG